VAEADSGNMGGDLSHEFHFPTPKGEDHVISCNTCDYVANEELAQSPAPQGYSRQSETEWTFVNPEEQASLNGKRGFTVWRGVSLNRSKLINVWYVVADDAEVNSHAVKAVVPDLDPGVKDVATVWAQSSTHDSTGTDYPTVVNLVDYRLSMSILHRISTLDPDLPFSPASPSSTSSGISASVISEDASTKQPLNLLRIADGDGCPRCANGKLRVQKAIELGHTFFLGTRYSVPLQATVDVPSNILSTEDLPAAGGGEDISTSRTISNVQIPMQMGCHGIGVSRMIGAVAEALVDDRGLNWPRIIAPYEVVVVPVKGQEVDALEIYDALVTDGESTKDVVLDDRDHSFAWKMRDADLIGYPVLVVVGKSWTVERTCEVQCHRLKLRQHVPFSDLSEFVSGLLARL